MSLRADFHVHSRASDGALAPADLVRLALERDLDWLAITDHDTVAGLPEALSAASGTRLGLIPSVELSSAIGDDDVHILAYHVDASDPALLEHLTVLREGRARRAERILAVLREAGLEIDPDVVPRPMDGGAIGRAHLARALVRAGHATDISDAFRRYIGRGKPYYVPKDTSSPQEVVALVLQLGAIPVLAHPGITAIDRLIPQLVEAGLRGIEAYHGEHTPEQCAHYESLARGLGLLVTGGSDFHGPSAPNAALGSIDLPDVDIEALVAARP